MTNFKRQVLSVVTASAMLVSLTGPAFADTSITITGNGENSDNTVNTTVANTTTVTQNNDAYVSNHVDSNADTGGNDASHNNGGNVTVDTGNAKTTTTVSNNLNSNAAQVDCNCNTGDTTVKIANNAEGTDNDATLKRVNTNNVTQDNDAHVYNNVDSNAKTGGNDANHNNGGNVSVTTGDATTHTTVSTSANINQARLGGNGAGSNGGSASILVSGNAEGSDNNVALTLANSASVRQYNDAWISNDVDANAKTGWNDANHNNGGNVTVDTGNAESTVDVDNMANFNAADLDCGCLMGVDATVSNNAEDTNNDITATLTDSRTVFSDNDAGFRNDVNSDAYTGANDAEHNNSGSLNSDPSVTTGDATNVTGVHTSANVNTVGSDLQMPEFDMGGFHLNLSFDLSDLLGALGLV